jgi:thioester reductase-like protein
MDKLSDLNSKKYDNREPIAIVGLGCRFPGGITSPESFWEFLRDGKDGITEVPSERWDLNKFYDPDPNKKGKIYVKKGGFLEDIDMFDPGFFGISPKEAAFMDPQQRITLEIVWEALEDGGLPPANLRGSKTGVYVGVFAHDYMSMHLKESEQNNVGVHSGVGASPSIVANRVSYVFDFKGPSIVIDTACSSSLTAIHYACRDLWNKEIELALAGGVNLTLFPQMSMVICGASMLSPTGYSKSFNANADGYARSEGAGIIALKTLTNALANQDQIYAVIRGTAANQDGIGKSQGLTVPNGESQKTLIQETLEISGVEPGEIQYVEAHGTGTPVGDPIEANALGTVFSEKRSIKNPCVIGSVKSNFGHTEAAAGVAGVIKTALMLKHRQIPPNLHFETPNPNIPFAELKLKVPTQLESWPLNEFDTRLAGVNSFGFGGSNAHAILEEFPQTNTFQSKPDDKQKKTEQVLKNYLIPLSAHSQQALKDTAQSYLEFINEKSVSNHDIGIYDFGYSASLRRNHHPYRLTIAATALPDLSDKLKAFIANEKRHGMARGKSQQTLPPKIVFVFSGMGQQTPNMGLRLMEKEPIVRQHIEKCDRLFRHHTEDWSIIEELSIDEKHSRIHETQIAQPCLFALQTALAALWQSWGIKPSAIVGHSGGENAAAYVAGILSLEEAAQGVYHRSRLQSQTAGMGKMLAAELSPAEFENRFIHLKKSVSIGAINSISSITLSGDIKTLEEIAGILEKEKVFNRILNVEVPYHSPVMDSILPEFREVMDNITPLPEKIPLVSTVIGDFIDGKKLNVDYWCKNIRQPVRFADACDKLIQSEHNMFLEIAAHPVLSNSIRENLSQCEKKGYVFHSLRRKESDEIAMLASLGQIHCTGYSIDWNRLYNKPSKFIKLPLYSWQREPYWNESEKSIQKRKGTSSHPFIGQRLNTPNPTWEINIDHQNLQYIKDHVIQGKVVFPGAAFIEIALAAGMELFGEKTFVLEDVEMKAPLLLSNEKYLQVQMMVENEDVFSIYSNATKNKSRWIRHWQGKLTVLPEPDSKSIFQIEEIKKRCTEEIPQKQAYLQLESHDLFYGPKFQGLEYVWKNETEGFGKIKLNDFLVSELDNYLLHPAILDAGFQIMAVIQTTGTYLPKGLKKIQLFGHPKQQCWGHARIKEKNFDQLKSDIWIFDETGKLLVELTGLHLQRLTAQKTSPTDSIEDHLYESQWILNELPGFSSKTRDSSFFPSSHSIAQKILPEIDRLFHQHQRKQYYEDLRSKLDTLTKEYIIESLLKLGWSFDIDKPFSSDALADQLNIVSDFQQYFNSLLNILGRFGVLKKKDNLWNINKPPGITDSKQTWNSILQKHPAFLAELTIIERCGSQLKELLRGKIDPITTIFSTESSVIEHFYQDSPNVKVSYPLMRKAISALLDHLPECEQLRVLEIGAGTGALTSHIISLFPNKCAEYCFSDISSGFTRQAEQKFKGFDFIKYKTLDIETDPREQGFNTHPYDLILASNVLHATSNLNRSLDNIKTLLSSGGMLVFIELTKSAPWIDLIFGTLKGWWSFADYDLRPTHPILAKKEWLNLLKNNGFNDLSNLSECGENSQQHVFIAKRSEIQEPDKNQEIINVSQAEESTFQNQMTPWIVFKDEFGFADKLITKFKKKKIQPIVVKKGEFFNKINSRHYEIRPEKLEDFQHLFELVCPDLNITHTLIYMWDIDNSGIPITCISLGVKTNTYCKELLFIVQALMSRGWMIPPHLEIVTNCTQTVGGIQNLSINQSPIWGMRRTLVNEHPELETRIIDISSKPVEEEINSLIHVLLHGDNEDEIVLRGKRRFVNRLYAKQYFQTDTIPKESYGLYKTGIESFERFSFLERNRRLLEPRQVEIQVNSSSLNLSDLIKTSMEKSEELDENGLISGFGMECSGTIMRKGNEVKDFNIGDHVIGFGSNCIGNYSVLESEHIFLKPSHISFEESATIPVAFLTAYYTLHNLAHINQGDRVLIHNATSDVGLAAIQVAKAAGANVLATTDTSEKKAFLKAMGIQNIDNSDLFDFAEETNRFCDEGSFDIVLNMATRKTIDPDISILKPFTGRYIDVVSFDHNSRLKTDLLIKGIAYFVFDLAVMAQKRPQLITSTLKNIVEQIENKVLHPLPYRCFPISEINSAFGCLKNNTYIGKLCLNLMEPGVSIVPNNKNLDINADGTYLITGGLGGVGLKIAKWLASCGAQHLVLIGRRGVHSTEIAQKVQAIRDTGVKVIIASADVEHEQSIASIISNINQNLPPLRGVIHSVMTMDASLLIKMTPQQLKKVMNPKILGAWNLHVCTLGLNLDFFLMFSSFASVVGSVGLAHYSAANCFLDSLAYYRKTIGLPATSISWGVIGDTGYFKHHEHARKNLEAEGFLSLSFIQICKAIKWGVDNKRSHLCCSPVDWNITRKHMKVVSDTPRFSKLTQSKNDEEAFRKTDSNKTGAIIPFKENQSVGFTLKNLVANTIGISPESLDDQQYFTEFNFDSLLAVELGMQINQSFKVNLPKITLLEADLNILTLTTIIERELLKHDNPLIEKKNRTQLAPILRSDINLNNEAMLPIDISPKSLPINYNVNPQIVLLTGITGFLGAYLLIELIHRTKAKIICLVRASNQKKGHLKIKENLQSYGIWKESFNSRIKILVGDLSKEHFSVCDDDWDQLADEVDVIYHNGAWLNFAQPYSTLKATNVLGTIEILKLACEKKTKPVHYISTLITLAQTVADPMRVSSINLMSQSKMAYDSDYIQRNGFNIGYHQSKWVADELVQQAGRRGLPISIYRPTLISGDSETGVCNITDYICLMIKGCIEMGSAPDQDVVFDFSPVDYLSKAIIYLSNQQKSFGTGFVLKNPKPIKWKSLIDWISSYGFNIKCLKPEKWRRELFEFVGNNSNSPFYQLLPLFEIRPLDQLIVSIPPHVKSLSILEENVTRPALNRAEISCPPADDELLQTYFSFLIRSGFLNKPIISISSQENR